MLRTVHSPNEPGSQHPPLKGRGGVRFAGYAAVFDRRDKGGDVIRAGAFARSLGEARDVPLLWQHKAGAVIGRIEHLSEDRRGLRVIARLGEGAEAERAARLLQSGRLDGLSFGYRVREATHGGGQRELTELDLVEVSLVARPMQPRARVHAVEG
ncbi:MAG TPA: HK97 family phage prohead protease [Sphingomicrobium sp.]|nr:HK97 family phage prohead protease [Sphingomicrobium sp.]